MEIETAKKDVSEMFESLAPMVTEIVEKYSKNMDKIVSKLMHADTMSNEELRQAMLELNIETYMFGMSKDASLLRQECATTLLKEAQAKAYNEVDGTQVIRSNHALVATADRQVVSMLYSAVANLLKTKQDEGHRLCNTINSILISRSAEAKLAYVDVNNNNNNSEPTKQILNESTDNVPWME